MPPWCPAAMPARGPSCCGGRRQCAAQRACEHHVLTVHLDNMAPRTMCSPCTCTCTWLDGSPPAYNAGHYRCRQQGR